MIGMEGSLKEVTEMSKRLENVMPYFFNELPTRVGGDVHDAISSYEKKSLNSEEKLVIKEKSGWPDSIIKFITSMEEIGIYEKANLEVGETKENLQRTDIDFDLKDPFGNTNLERMEQGKSPIVDGEPVELHHIGQRMDSPLAELKMTEHRGVGNDGILHDKMKVSEIDRGEFKKEREDHWKARAAQERHERGGL